MFTSDDDAFLERLGLRADTRLSGADPATQRLDAAITGLRSVLSAQPAPDRAAMDEVEGLLDAVWWTSSAGEHDQARRHAAHLARAIRRLGLPGLRAMRIVDAAQQIRTLVVLAA